MPDGIDRTELTSGFLVASEVPRGTQDVPLSEDLDRWGRGTQTRGALGPLIIGFAELARRGGLETRPGDAAVVPEHV
jgi:hypothetical protein